MLNKGITKRGGGWNLSVPTLFLASLGTSYFQVQLPIHFTNSRPKQGLMDFLFLENLNISEKLLFYVFIEFQSLRIQSIMNLTSWPAERNKHNQTLNHHSVEVKVKSLSKRCTYNTIYILYYKHHNTIK